MGQDQTKPADQRSRSERALYEAEQAKMVHVTTADQVKVQLAEHDIEANRLLAELGKLQPVKPLIRCSEEQHFLNKNEKVAEEVLKKSPIFSANKVPHDRCVKALATFQTSIMREGTHATIRQDEIAGKMQHASYFTSQLKTVAWHKTHDVSVFNHSLQEADRLQHEVMKLATVAMELTEVLADIELLLTPEQKMEIRTAIEEEEQEKARQERASNPSFGSNQAARVTSGPRSAGRGSQ